MPDASTPYREKAEEMPRFRKKPVVIDAIQYDGTVEKATEIIDWVLAGGGTAHFHAKFEPRGPAVMVDTLEGSMRAGKGWWVIRGVAGEFYPCDGEIFSATYTLVADEETPFMPGSPLHGPGNAH